MIDFRYHVVSIVAVFLALATGLVLGASLLNTDLIKVLQNRTSTLADDKDQLRADLDDANKESDFLQQMAGALGPLAVRDQLLGRSVVLVSLPGADDAAASAVSTLVQDAGGLVTGSVDITDRWASPDDASALDGLVAQLVPNGVVLPSGTAYDRAAALLAAAIVDDPTSTGGGETEAGTTTSPPPDQGEEPPDEPSQHDIDAILAGLQAGGYISYEAAPPQAELAVVISGGPPESSDADEIAAINSAWVTLASSLDDVGVAAVLTGPTSAGGSDGAISALRAESSASDSVSTVVAVEDASGQVATVLALSAEANGVTGHYGPGAPDGAIPDLTSTGG